MAFSVLERWVVGAAIGGTVLVRAAWVVGDLPPLWFVPGLVIGWAGLLLWLLSAHPDRRAQFGLTREGLLPASAAVAVLLGLTMPALLAIGLWRGHPPSLALFLGFLVYPIWGLFQQLILQGIVVEGLRDKLPTGVLIGVVAFLFAAVHLPSMVLTAATFGLALVLTPIWLKTRNLWPLAVAHGWLGSLLYCCVLGRTL